MPNRSEGSIMRFTRWAGLACLPLVLVAVGVRALPADGTAASALAAEPSMRALASSLPSDRTSPPSSTATSRESTTLSRATPLAMPTSRSTAGSPVVDRVGPGDPATGPVIVTLRPFPRLPVGGAAPEAMTVLDEPMPVVAQPAGVEPMSSAAASTPAAVAATSPGGSQGDPVAASPTPRMRTVWSCPNGGLLTGTTCVTTRPYTFHTETAEYTVHEESTPYTSHRETRYGQPCTYLPNPSAPGGLDIFCTPYAVDVRDSTPAGWQDSGSAWVRQVRDTTPAGWSDTGTRWTREVRDDAPAGFTDDGTAWRRFEPATSQEVPA